MIYEIDGVECVVNRIFINEEKVSTILERIVELLLIKVMENEQK